MHQLPTPYQAPLPQLWEGRTTAPELGVQYWYQQVHLVDLEKESETEAVPHVTMVLAWLLLISVCFRYFGIIKIN